ncbi:MAG: thioredoxin family protein [Bacteroidia bacterium]
MITKELLEKAFSYNQYRNLIIQLLSENKTTGSNHSEDYINYTKMNVQRMERLDKSIEIKANVANELLSLNQALIWLVITEAWCGDAAQICPVIAKLSDLTSKIDLKFILRDEHPEIMNQYLTNGGKSIPILVCLDAATLQPLGHWGPRPQTAQQMVLEHKNNPQEPYLEFVKKLQLWYLQDKTESTQQEITNKLKEWSKYYV